MIKRVIKPVAEELGKFGEAAKSQVVPEPQESDQTKKVVEDIYGVNEKTVTTEELKSSEIQKKQKLAKLRQELHANYYQRLTNPPKPKEEPKAVELEKEKKMKELEVQKKEAKKVPPLAVQRAQKVEKYPGASG